jgi:hypothetical protein
VPSALDEAEAVLTEEQERRLFRACYYIAVSTLDDSEYEEVITLLQAGAAEETSPNRELVARYLRWLGLK